LIPASVPRTERAPKADRVPGRRGRPAIHTCIQQIEGKRVGRPAKQGPIMFRATTGKRGRPAFQGPIEQLIFFGPVRKRGPKPLTAEQKAQREADRALNGTETLVTGKKRGRLSEKERITAAKVGEVIPANGGGFWKIIAPGLPSYMAV